MNILTTKKMLGEWVDVNDPKHNFFFSSETDYTESQDGKNDENQIYKIHTELSVEYKTSNIPMPSETITMIGDDTMKVSGGKNDGIYNRDKNSPYNNPSTSEQVLRDPTKDTPIMGAWVHETNNNEKRIYTQTTITTFVSIVPGGARMSNTVQYTIIDVQQKVEYGPNENDTIPLVVEDFDGDLLVLASTVSNDVVRIKRQPITILSAIYGTDTTGFDVTQKCQELVNSGNKSFDVRNTNFPDPAVGLQKRFAIVFRKDGKLYAISGTEGMKIDFETEFFPNPIKTPTVTTESVVTTNPSFTIDRATYGTDKDGFDVTEICQALVNSGKTTIPIRNSTFTDPSQGYQKTFAISYTKTGETTHYFRACSEGSNLSLTAS